jgi:hypothetical protein
MPRLVEPAGAYCWEAILSLRQKWSRRRKAAVAVSIMALAFLMLIYLAFPWRYVSTMTVQNYRMIDLTATLAGRKLAPLSTPVQHVVDFSAPVNIAGLRRQDDFGIISATLFICNKTDIRADEVISQRAEYASDRGRVKYLGAAKADDGKTLYNYRVIFDDALTQRVNGTGVTLKANDFQNELCFRLTGGSMWLGAMRSNTVALKSPSNSPIK